MTASDAPSPVGPSLAGLSPGRVEVGGVLRDAVAAARDLESGHALPPLNVQVVTECMMRRSPKKLCS